MGRDLAPVLEAAGHEITGVDIDDFDISDRASVEGFFGGSSAEVCLHAAAYTDVDACESEEERAFRVNAKGAANVAAACARRDIPLVYVSTDYVFPGDGSRPCGEGDATGPISAYGRSKLAGEQEVVERNPASCIVRTCGLYGLHGRNFVDSILAKSARGESLTVVSDQTVSPTWTVELARALAVILAKGARGIYHAASDGQCTWYEFAREIVSIAGHSVELSEAKSRGLGRAARRPAFSALDSGKLKKDLGHEMAGWREALAAYLETKKASA